MSDIIDILKDEHEEIEAFTFELEEKCLDFMVNDTVNIAAMREDILFIRNFADSTHHQKEEDILFREMVHIDEIAKNLVQHGMLVEHDMAKQFVLYWEEALDAYEKDQNDRAKLAILTNAMGYAYLLRRHIVKENTVVYPYAEKHLSEDVLTALGEEARHYKQDE